MRPIYKQSLPLLLSLVFFCMPAFGLNLSQAKQEGYIGEQANGYVGIVIAEAPDEIKKIVKETNHKRKAYYQSVAKNNGIHLREVEILAGRKTINRTSTGQYIQQVSGKWEKK